MVYPVTLFCFALLVNPRPPTLYWRVMLTYTCTLIFFRFLFQYPLFALCTSLTSAPFYTTRSDLSDPYCNAVLSYSSDGSLVQNIAGLIKVTSRPNAESGWLWTFMSGTAVDWVTLAVLLVHRKALKDDGLWAPPLLLTPQEEEEQREQERKKRLAELRRLKERRAKQRQARAKAREKRRAREDRARRKDVLVLARLLHKRQLNASEEAEKRRLEQQILAGNLRHRKKHQQPASLDAESKQEAETGRLHRLGSVNTVKELEEMLRAEQEEYEEEEHRERKEDADLHSDVEVPARSTDSDAEAHPRLTHRRASLRQRNVPLSADSPHHVGHVQTEKDGPHKTHRHHHHHHHGHSHRTPHHPHKRSPAEADGDETTSLIARVIDALNDGSKKVGKDFYLATFVLQVVLFLVVLIFYNTQSNIYQSAENNYIPLQFVLVLLAIFILIALERVVYLYQSLILKLALQLSTLITFFVIALVLGLQYSALLQVIYVMFVIYWTLSALQYYWGYPRNTQGKALMRSTTFWSSTALTIYRSIPFVFELQNLLDWSCIRTTLGFGEWLILEDILANFYFVQCNTDGMRSGPKTEGKAVGKVTKWLVGVTLFCLLVLLLFGPLFLFSSQAATSPDNVTQLTTRIELNGFSALFYTDQFSAVELDSSQWQTAVDVDSSLLTSQDVNTLQVLYPQNTGNGVWQITPGGRAQLLAALNSSSVVLNVTLVFTRSSSSSAPVVYTQYSRALSSNETAALLQALTAGDATSSAVLLPSCYPRYLSLSSTDSSITDSVTVLSTDAADLNTCALVYHPFNSSQPSWWEVLDGRAGANGTLGEVTADAPPLYVFSQRIPSSNSLNLGLVAIYVTVVLAIGLKVRVYVQGNSGNLIYQQVPDPSVVLTMCKDLYSARLLRQLVLEEQLYVALINLLRSPERLLAETGQYVHFYPLSPSPPPSPVDDEKGAEDERERGDGWRRSEEEKRADGVEQPEMKGSGQ